MRRVHDTRRRPGAPDIRRIGPTVRSRDDIPAIPIGLQDPCSDEGTRKRLSGLPGRMVPPGKGRRVGGPGMEPLIIPVPGVVRQGPGCGSDRLRKPANGHRTIRRRPEAGPRPVGRGRITDTNTGVWWTTCRSSRRSFPPRSEGWSWRGATGWPEKAWRRVARPPSFLRGRDRRPPSDRPQPADGRGAVHGPGRVPGLRGAWAARLAAEGIPLEKAPERPPPGGHVTARQPAPEGRGGAAPAGPEAGGQGGGQLRGDRRQVGYPGPIGQYPGLHRPCQVPGGPDRTADPEGRDDPAKREGAPDIQAAHALDIEGKGRGPGGARRPRPRS